MSHQDVVFFRNFAIVLAILLVAGVLFYLLAQLASSPTEQQTLEARKRQEIAIEERIKPVGRVRVAGVDDIAEVERALAEPGAAAAAASTADLSTLEPDLSRGQQVFDSACTACHGAGIAGAPKLGDAVAWEARLPKGLDQLVGNAINGYQGQSGMMPAKGGNAALSDADIKHAVAYMVAESTP